VSAKDRGTGKEQSMTVTGGSGLSKDEIDRMIKDAEAHAADDARMREEAETRNAAEQLVYSTEKFVSENEDKLPADGKDKVKTAITDLKSALDGTDIEAVKSAHEALAKASQELGSALYAAQSEAEAGAAGSAGEGSTGSSSKADDDVVDAEIVDEDK
jgi:molecular chaperone DnaK